MLIKSIGTKDNISGLIVSLGQLLSNILALVNTNMFKGSTKGILHDQNAIVPVNPNYIGIKYSLIVFSCPSFYIYNIYIIYIIYMYVYIYIYIYIYI